MFTEGKYFKDYINPGYYVDEENMFIHLLMIREKVGFAGYLLQVNLDNERHTLYPYVSGPDATFSINAVGNASIYGDSELS